MKISKKSSKNYRKEELNQSLHLNREWLYLKYITEGLSTYEIAKIVNRNPKNIYCKLKDFEIPTRTRAETIQKNAWWKQGLPSKRIGKHHSEKTKKQISKTRTGKIYPNLRGKNNGMYGKRSANWKGGVTPERQKLYGQDLWKNIVKEVFERDNWLCQKCGGKHQHKNPLHTHHIKSWADYPDNRFDLGNLITICKKCHHWIHSKKNTKKDFLG
jgi:5-methylcytosine-specific restriction endonuclease McrA